MLPKNVIIDIEEQLQMINMLASDILGNCKTKITSDSEELVSEFPSCVGKVQEIQDRIRRLSIMLRKYLRSSDFMF